MKRIIMTILFLFVLSACSHETDESNEKLHIYTSIYPLQFIAQQLLGDEATVSSVYPPGVDAHTYEPAARDITAIAKADAFFYVGGHMESFSETIARTLDGHPVTLNALINQADIFLTNESGEIDPHLWLDPSRMIQVADWMKSQLEALEPDLTPVLEKNYLSLQTELHQLDESLATVSKRGGGQPLLVVHGAYRYWTERYGLEQIAIHGMMAGEESSQKKLAKIVRLAEEKNIHYVIYEPNNDDKVANIVTKHLQAEKVVIHDLEVLTDEDVSNGEDYLSLMERNIHVLEKVLGTKGGDNDE